MNGTNALTQRAPRRQGDPQIRVERNQATTIVFGGVIPELDQRSDFTGRIEHHVPRQVGDLAGAQAGLDRQENDDTVAFRISGRGGVDEEVFDLLI